MDIGILALYLPSSKQATSERYKRKAFSDIKSLDIANLVLKVWILHSAEPL